jgi:membrane protein
MKFNDTTQLFKTTFSEWSEDKAARLAAALAYYTVVALAPLLVIVIAIAGLAFGQEATQGQVVGQIASLVGQQSAEQIQGIIASASQPKSGILATVAGIVTLLFGASGVFGQLQDGMNTIWEVTAKPGRGILGLIKDRFLSLTMVFGVGFLLLVSLALSAALAAVGKFLGELLPLPEVVMLILSFIVSFAVITLLFAMIFKVLPDVKITWGDVWIGAAMTALLFTVGKILLGLYLGKSSVGSAYGAAGSIIVILIWVYYSAQILFFGAEFTQVYANRYGSHITPDEDAVPITEEARAEQGMIHRDDLKKSKPKFKKNAT